MLSKVLNRDRRSFFLSFFLSLCLSVFLSPVFLTRNGLNLYLFNDNERHTTKKERKKEKREVFFQNWPDELEPVGAVEPARAERQRDADERDLRRDVESCSVSRID